LIYRSVAPESQLTWFDRAGKQVATVGDAAPMSSFDLSPDGSFAVFDMLDADGRLSDLWLLDLAHGQTSRFTFDHAINRTPRWSYDGKRIAFVGSRQLPNALYLRTVSAPHDEDLLITTEEDMNPMCGLPDGRVLASIQGKMAVLSPGKPSEPVHTDDPFDARISDDGHWLAYGSKESGHPEIYVESYPGLTGKQRISSNGGRDPHWRKDGKELFFSDLSGAVIYSVKIETNPELRVGTPIELFRASGAFGFAVSPDGERFLLNVSSDDLVASPLTVVMDWTNAIQR
jgi:Tol biopolymer transport system component